MLIIVHTASNFDRILSSRLCVQYALIIQFSKLWEGSKEGLQNVKLKVEYSYDFSNAGAQPAEASSQPAASSPGGSPLRTHSEGGQDLRNRLKRSGDSTTNVADNNTGGGEAVDSSAVAAGGSSSSFPSNATPEAIFAELQSLRRKYDAVVEYTVHLTAERDAIVAQLDLAQTEIAKEKRKNKNEGADGAGANSKAGKKGDKANGDKKVVEKVSYSFIDQLCMHSNRCTICNLLSSSSDGVL